MDKRIAIIANQTPSKNWFKLMHIFSNKQYKKPPKNCLKCNNDNLVSLEIVGIEKDCMFWECVYCGIKYMKYSKSYTYKLLKQLDNCNVNIEDFMNYNDWEEN